MVQQIVKVFFYVVFTVTTLNAFDDYILADQYYNNNPHQKNNLNIFEKLVKQNNPNKLNPSNKHEIKIYMVYPGKQISDYWRRSKVSFEKRLQKLGIKYKLIDYFTKPSIEISKQAQALQEALDDEADYLIFTLDAKKHFKFISSIIQNKKPKIILQNITTPLKALQDNQVFFYVGFDHTTGTKMIAKEFIKELGTHGKYAIMYGPKGYVSSMRGDSFYSYMNQHSNFQLADSYYTNFDKEIAKKATLDLLKNNKDIAFIYACSTDISLGVIEALKEKNLLGKIKVNGWGGGSKELEAISKAEMDFTVMRINDDNGVAMAESIKLDLTKQRQQIPLIYSGELVIVRKNMDKQDIEKLQKKAFRYSGF